VSTKVPKDTNNRCGWRYPVGNCCKEKFTSRM